MNSIMCKWTRPFWGQTAEGDPKAFPRPRNPLFAVPALRELASACRVSILCDDVTVPTVCFSWGSPRVARGRQKGFPWFVLKTNSAVEKLTRSSLQGVANKAVFAYKNGRFVSRSLLLGVGFLEASKKA